MSRREALVITPLEKELAPLVALLRDRGHSVEPVEAAVPAVRVDALGVTLAAGGHGKVQLAVATRHLLDTRPPLGAVVVVGAAGALDAALGPGDVIVGTESVEHDYTTLFHGPGPAPRHTTDPRLVAVFAADAGRHPFSVHVGPIAGGDEDVISPERARAVAARTGALCVAWEGPGGARAAAFSGVPFAEVRAVTDGADGDALASYRVHLAEAVQNAGRVVLDGLARWLQSGGTAPASRA